MKKRETQMVFPTRWKMDIIIIIINTKLHTTKSRQVFVEEKNSSWLW